MVKNYFLRLFIVGALVSATLAAEAQHDPYFTHFRWNRQAYNPAAAGVKKDYICLNGLTHYQYRQFNDQTPIVGTDAKPEAKEIKNVAPETYNLNVNTLLGFGSKDRYKIGVGATFLSDRIGFMQTTTVKGAINYRQAIGGDFSYLSYGIEIGSTTFGYVNPQFLAIDPNDPRIPDKTSNSSQSKLDLGIGIYYHQAKFLNVLENFYLGASYNHLNAAKYDLSIKMANGQFAAMDMDFVRYLYITTGADWQLSDPNWMLEPAVLVKYNPNLQLDISMTALWANTFRMGLGYRTASDALPIMIGWQKGEFQFGYSYDITLSKLNKVSSGTHEIFLKYCLPITFPPPVPKGFRVTPRFMGRHD